MRKRLLKKYLSIFDLTLKDGDVAGRRPIRRRPPDWFLPGNHPLTIRRLKRYHREMVRVLPALLKARICDVMKASLARRVVNRGSATKLVWSERGGRPRQRLLSAVSVYKARVSTQGKPDRQYLAELDAAYSALLRRWPKVIGKRLQPGTRVKLTDRNTFTTPNH